MLGPSPEISHIPAEYVLRGYQVQIAVVAPISASSGGSRRWPPSMLGGPDVSKP
jgi:hypothetical protein